MISCFILFYDKEVIVYRSFRCKWSYVLLSFNWYYHII